MVNLRFLAWTLVFFPVFYTCSDYQNLQAGKTETEEGECSTDGWCWQNPLPHGKSYMRDIWGSGPDDIWAVGGVVAPCPECGGGPSFLDERRTAGEILHWNGNNWSIAKFRTKEALSSVWGTSHDNVWAVGTSGVIFHWDGSSWEEIARDETSWLRRVIGVSADDVWAIGYGRTSTTESLYHWDGSMWSRVPGPDQEGSTDLVDAWASSASDVWAIGERAWKSSSVIHWDGKAWSEWDLGIPEDVKRVDLRSIWGSSADNVWVVGECCRKEDLDGHPTCASKGLLAHWNGQDWSLEFLDDRIPNLVWGFDSQDIRMFGGFLPGWELDWDGQSWSEKETGFDHSIRSLWAASGKDLWAVAGDSFQHFEQDQWKEVPTPFEGVNNMITDMSSAAPDAVWAVGAKGTVLFYDGVSWQQQDAGIPEDEECLGVFAASASDVWIPSLNGRMSHFDGQQWTSEHFDLDILGIQGRSSDDIWCYGRRGKILHFDGKSWSQRDVDSEKDIWAMEAVASNDVWAVGQSGGVFHWEGNVWTPQNTGIQDPLLGVGVTPSGKVWVLSMYDIYRKASSKWIRSVTLPQTIYWLTSMEVVEDDDMWIVGGGGNIFHWDGESWQRKESGTPWGLKGIYSSGDHLWAYGYGGTILHRSR